MRTLLVAGGSGGHLIPALTLADHLRRQGPCLLLTSTRPIETVLLRSFDKLRMSGVPQDERSRLECATVDLKRFTPLWRWLSPRYVVRQIKAVWRVRSILREFRPDVVVGFGGYLSASGVFIAQKSGIPTILHEQNVLPGKANRWLSSLTDTVAVSFPQTKDFLSGRAHVEVTGNPIRPHLKQVSPQQARAFFCFDDRRPIVVIMGGSQGSQAINWLALRMWESASAQERQRVQVVHLAGPSEIALIEERYRAFGMEARVYGFLREIEMCYAAADLVISRAGATSIAEMMALQVPAILIPYPHAGAHQLANAQWMESVGGAVVCREAGLTPEALWKEIAGFLKWPGRLAQMRAALRGFQFGVTQVPSGASAVERLSALVERTAV